MERKTESERERQRVRERQTERERDRQRGRETVRDGERDRQGGRKREDIRQVTKMVNADEDLS
jgi:serine/threonine protein kinase KIN1/2